jgi:hypothetical protein
LQQFRPFSRKHRASTRHETRHGIARGNAVVET